MKNKKNMKVSRVYLNKLITEEHKRLLQEMQGVYADPIYITRVLGINLPLNESGRYYLSEAKKAQILHEHLLLEGLLDSITNYVKTTSGNLKNLLLTLKNIFSDKTGKLMEKYNNLLEKKVTLPLIKNDQRTGVINYIDKIIGFITSKMPNALPTFKKGLEAIKAKILEWFNKIKVMAKNSWKTVLYETTYGVMLGFIIDKVKELGIDAIKDNTLEAINNWFNDYVKKHFTTDVWTKILSTSSNITTFLGFIGPIVGGTVLMAEILSPVTREMATMPIPPQPTGTPSPAPA
jgi:hypothetical protein